MDTAVVSALSAVLGSIVGGSASIATAWITQRTLGRRESINAEMRKRESLYADFIAECSKAVVDALDHSLNDPAKIIQLYAFQNRIRLSASDAVVAATQETIDRIIKQYFQDNLAPDAMRTLILESLEDDTRADPLKTFSAACRRELIGLLRAA